MKQLVLVVALALLCTSVGWAQLLSPSPPANPKNDVLKVNDMQAVPVRIGVGRISDWNNPDVRLLARLAVAIVQKKLARGTPFEKIGYYKGRGVNHVDMKFPDPKHLAPVIDRKQTYIDSKKEGRVTAIFPTVTLPAGLTPPPPRASSSPAPPPSSQQPPNRD
ncbi:unnamed protein product, partial [Mesorhabditis spiculigera]